jgi:hypothetical protein
LTPARAWLCLPLLLVGLSAASVDVISSGDRAVRFRYAPGEPSVEIDVTGKSRLTLADADPLAHPGSQFLPMKMVRVGIPQTGGFDVAVVLGPVRTLAAPEPVLVPMLTETGEDVTFRQPVDAAGGAVTSEQVRWLRGVRYVPLVIRPARYDASKGAYDLFEWVEVTVSFRERPRSTSSADPMTSVVSSMLLNGASAASWRLDVGAGLSGQLARTDNWLRLNVDTTGLFGVTGADLAQAGLTLAGLDPATIELYGVGERGTAGSLPDSMTRIPVHIMGGEDGRLDPGDCVVFYAFGADCWAAGCSVYARNLFTGTNVYWLTWGGTAGARMPGGLQPDTAGTQVARSGWDALRVERDAECPARAGLLWVWQTLFKPAERAEAVFETAVRPATPVTTHRIRCRVLSDSAANDVTVTLNRRELRSFPVGVIGPGSSMVLEIDSVVPLRRGDNTLGIVLRGTGGKRVYVDYFELSYERRLSLAEGQLHFLHDSVGRWRFEVTGAAGDVLVVDVTDRLRPRRVLGFERAGDTVRFCHDRAEAGARELVVANRGQLRRPVSIERRHPGGLSAASRAADHWIVVPDGWEAAGEALARFREGRVAGIEGARVRVASISDVYDDYAFGMAEPVAVKRFLADKRPAYALLVGDATCDYRDNLGRRGAGVPAYEYGFGLNPDNYDRTALAFDAWYADWDGDGGSPDVVLGRVTARTAAEFRAYVDKVVRYETDPIGYWAKRFLLLADDEFLGQSSRPDPIGFQHMVYCEAMSVLPDNRLDAVKVYLTEYPYAGVKSKPAATAALARELGRGGSVLVFFGHGSGFDLTHESVLNIATVPQLANGGRLPFCYFGSCSVGRFDDLLYESIAEEMVRMSGGGAIASVAATKATTSGSNLVFARNLLTPLFGQPGRTAGESFFAAWPTDRIYHFFGDPAVVLRLPGMSSQPVALRPDTLRPGQAVAAWVIAEADSGVAEWAAFGPRRLRSYESSQGRTSYMLPGVEFGRGSGLVRNGLFECSTLLPVGLPLDTIFAGNGYYAPVERSCRLSGVVAGTADLGLLRDTIPYLAGPLPSGDSAGPAVQFTRAGTRVREGDVLPPDAGLEVSLIDPAGVMLSGVAAGCAPLFFVNRRSAAIDLSDRLVFDRGSFVTARCEVKPQLDGDDTLVVIAFDNLMNGSETRLPVRAAASGPLRIDSVLCYPNPARRDCRVTFLLSRAATVRVRIHSLAGRLVADLGWLPAGAGFNSCYWDGRDRAGVPPANGVYLVSVTAMSSDLKGDTRAITVRERLVVQR